MANPIEIEWKKFLIKTITEGKWHTKDDGDEIIEIIDNHCFIPNIQNILFCGGENINLDIFLNMIEKGVFDIEGYPMSGQSLKEYVIQLDSPKHIYLTEEDSFIYTYPERLLNICQVNRFGEIVNVNQIDTIINRLKEHEGSNRAVANLYMCAFDKDEQHIPCLNFLQVLIRNNELSLHIMFRSNDLYSAFPNNMLFLQYLGLKITNELKKTYPLLKFKGIFYNSVSLHIYKGDYEQAKKVIEFEIRTIEANDRCENDKTKPQSVDEFLEELDKW